MHKVGDGWLLGEQKNEYFRFICGKCGMETEEVVFEPGTGCFIVTTHCPSCKQKYDKLKISGLPSKSFREDYDRIYK